MGRKRKPPLTVTGETPEAPVVLDLGGGWEARCLVVRQGTAPVVAEVRIVPPAALALDDEVLPDRVPPGGLPMKQLRKLTAHAIASAAREVFEQERADPEWRATIDHWWGYLGQPVAQRRPGRNPKPDEYYATWVAEYVAEGGVRDATARVAARHPGYTADDVRQLLNKARKRGLLTAAPPGRAGGEMTEKCRALLAAGPPDKEPPRGRRRRGPTPGGAS